MPPYLAGREPELQYFNKLLTQTTILENLVLTGLRGVGKTVLLETFRPIAIRSGWLWLGADLSEAASVTEDKLALRLLTDLSVITASVTLNERTKQVSGFTGESIRESTVLDFNTLTAMYNGTPGLIEDKLKHVLEFVWDILEERGHRGIIVAYDEAQNMTDHAKKEQYPLSILLDIFQSIQRKGYPLMLILTGLPTLFPKLVEARTFSERMFHVMFLKQLTREASHEAVTRPIARADCPIRFDDRSIETVCNASGGYPYFIQFICREVYDVWSQTPVNAAMPSVPIFEIERKLDSDFFAGRWAKVTDRQRTLLGVIAQLDNADEEFTVQEIVAASTGLLEKPFSNSHVNQMLAFLSAAGLVYKNRHGKYSFAVPLLARFIQRQNMEEIDLS